MEINTDFCKVTAIIRCEVQEKMELRLQEPRVHGYSVMQVKGCGEYTNFYCLDYMTTHARIEIFSAVHRAEAIAQSIEDKALTGVEEDGIVAALPVNKDYRIRLGAEIQPDEFDGKA